MADDMPLSKGLQVSPHSDLSINSGMRGVYGALTAFPLLQHSRCWEAVLEVLHSNLLRGGAELSLERMMFRIYCLPWSLSPAIEGGGGVGADSGGCAGGKRGLRVWRSACEFSVAVLSLLIFCDCVNK